MDFKDKIMLHGFRKVKCRWEVGEVGRWERWKGNEVARWERWESGEVARWEVLSFIQGWGTQGESSPCNYRRRKAIAFNIAIEEKIIDRKLLPSIIFYNSL